MDASHFAQVLSLGLLWTFFHCTGMCGPLIVGITAPRQPDRRPVIARASRVLAYQTGRGATYAGIGALAGLVGSAVESVIAGFANIAALVMAALFIVGGLASLAGATRSTGAGAAMGAILARALRLANRVPGGRDGFAAMVLTGLAMGFLPCALTFWVVGVAAASANPLEGAALMLLLLVMTTPSLLTAACLAAVGTRRAWAHRVAPVSLILSGIWMGAIAAAANDWISHVHLTFELGGEPYMIMFF